MKSLLKKALSQIAIVTALPEFRRPEVIFHDVLHSSQVRCKSSRKNQSRGQLKRLRNELYQKRHSKKVTWKIFSSKNGKLFFLNYFTDSQSKPDKCGSVKPKNISKVNPELIKLAKQINQSRREVFEATSNRTISKKTESVLFNQDYDHFKDDLKTLICS
ncbi:hypothetical protein MS3_00002825 [Schistosoma haematobium]|uniref:Uncharacterized protein n=1 Tax=Schistosoma haematobium TaxID=6185 RepID=A0A6A5DB51_SCHHA|nr:hypothetical protein MS3_00002825 [Schistosoma haematobium]KAH9589951.1 hypothetical protein MS3_00002825 [Schistosoma haematobium]